MKNSKKNRSRFWKNTISLFVYVVLRAASILENNDVPFRGCWPAGGLDLEKPNFVLYLYIFLHIAKLLNLLGFEPQARATAALEALLQFG